MIDKRLAVILSCVLAFRTAVAQAAPRDSVQDERAYAVAVAAIADSAIHHLDFFPERNQLRVQMAFLSSPNDPRAVPFTEIARTSASVAIAIDEGIQRFEMVVVPHDLQARHRELTKSLHAAATAADRLAVAANACSVFGASIQRCQTPFTGASTQLSNAYRDYLAIRAKIADQVLDTETHLVEFRVANR